MPSYDPTLFNVNPYYDDFNEDKKFLRMLFRPGYAVQSRELTQLQTILQNQLERFGNHIFKDGARIVGGEISTQTMNFVRILPQTANTPSTTVAATDIVGFNLIERTGTGGVSVKARVVDFVSKETEEDPYSVAVINYLSGDQFTLGATLECDNPDKSLTLTISNSTNVNLPHTGRCRVVGTNEGVYYVDGFFVKTDNQFEPAYTTLNGIRNFAQPTGVMGFQILSEIITEKDDYTLKDPANGTYNYNAPGSHRYKINLSLKFLETGTDQDFIELVTYANGEITKKVDETKYSDLVGLFAQRTYDESGNYIVKPFDVSMRNGSGQTFYADIGSGKAYVFGYEYETKFKDALEIPKARTTKSYQDYTIDNYYGNYVVGKYDSAVGGNACQIIPLFTEIRASLGESTSALKVYGATFAATGPDLSNAMFTARLVRMQPDDSQYSSQGTTMAFRAYLSEIEYLKTTGNPGTQIQDLYFFDQKTNLSYRLLKDITTARSSNPGTSSLLPIITDIDKVSLVYGMNGSTPTTMIKQIDEVSYIHETFRGFIVDSLNQFPSVALAQGVEFDWCLANGFVPSGTDVNIDEVDGYYVVYASGNNLPLGTLLKIVGESTTVGSSVTKVTAKISGEGDFVVFTSALPIGGYYLVGKSKNVSSNVFANPASKIRTKTLVSGSETITSTTNTLNTFKRVIVKNSSGSISSMYFVLNRADMLSIASILDSVGNDVSSEFLFDNGQRDALYDLARLYVKPDYFSKYDVGKTFQFTVSYSYFNHAGYGPFVKDSYLGISYENIPVYVRPSGKESIHLANAIDFRYLAKIDGYIPSGATEGTVVSATETTIFNRPVISCVNGFSPSPFSVVHSHEAYLPRIDKIVVSKDISSEGEVTTLRRIAGNPSDSPIIPEDLGDSMTLFVLSIPAYTFNATDVKAESIGNSRFTMKDIGNISKRVDNLEQYAVLNELELNIVSQNIPVSSGVNGIKRAILVDTFDGHSVADVSDIDHRCSIDVERGELKPSFKANCYNFQYNGLGGVTLTSDNILCADFTKYSTPVIAQDKASTTIQVNPFGLPNWVGNIKITPHADIWYNRAVRPLIKINADGVNDAWVGSNMNDAFGFGSQWNEWESIWSGISTELTDAESTKNADFFSKPRTGNELIKVQNKRNPSQGIGRYTESVEKAKGKYTTDFRKKDFYVEAAANTILNKSIIPMMRSKTITFNVYNMKPKTQVHVFFDNENVNQYCTVSGQSGPFTTNATDGSLLNVTMTIPDGFFEIGEKLLRVIDVADNVVENATTVAETVYYCVGLKQDDYRGISSIRPAEIRKQTPNSSKVISNPLYRQKNINVAKFNQWIDPLAQTFEVSESSYPNGFYLESVDLFFSSKDSDLPVTVELCPVVNGIPHTSVILPFSTVVKSPSAITANASTPTATNFKFTTPVYLAAGTYAILVKANTSKYSLFVANIGELDMVTDERISSVFSGGVLFKAQNSSEASGDASTDLMFNLNRCQFSTLTSPTIVLNHIDQTIDSVVNIVQPSVFAFTPPGVALTTKVKLAADEYAAIPNRNLYLDTTYTITDSEIFDLVFTPSITQVGVSTFMIDLDRTGAIVVQNLINASENGTQELAPASGKNDSTARYISRKITLPTGKIAYELKVVLDANLPKDTFIRVYGKTINASQLGTNPDNIGYKLMTEEVPNAFTIGGTRTNSLNQNDFREVSYKLVSSFSEPFDTFAVKICMYSSNSSRTPSVKNLRIVALQ